MERSNQNSRGLNRRQALGLLSGAGVAFAAACSETPTSPTSTTDPGTTTTTPTTPTGGTNTPATCSVVKSETEGPYPDRTGMLNNPAFYRQDVTEGRSGLPVTLAITIVNVNANCAPMTDAAVEIWQCDANGNYSEYAQPRYNGTGQTFLRGLQLTDANGAATFRTIYPGWYSGRATHIHVKVFRNGTLLKTTQIAFPEDVSAQVYQTGVYVAKGQNPTTNARDNVFSDGTDGEMATLVGDATNGYTATITFGVAG